MLQRNRIWGEKHTSFLLLKLFCLLPIHKKAMGDVLFTTVEKWQGSKPWGRFLDAGTGVHSLKWIQTLQTSAWVAITADHNMRNQIENDNGVVVRDCDRIVVGNWMDSNFCECLGKYLNNF